MNKFLLLFLGISLLLASCSKDTVGTGASYDKGIFVVNEGAFGSGTGTITHYDGTTATQDIFGKENAGKVLGNIAQSMIKLGDKYFIAVNNADKIQVVNATTFQAVGEISGISYPRYFATDGSKLYVSSYAKDFVNGFVYQIDPITLKVLASIPVNGLAEKMLLKDEQLYVTITSNASDVLPRNVLVIDINTNVIVKTITVGDNPTDIVSDKNGGLWVLCSGFNNWADPSLNTKGSIYNISGDMPYSFSVSNGAKGLVSDKTGEHLYYLADGQVYEFDIYDQASSINVVYEGNFYGIGFNPMSEELFLADAKDYQTAGNIVVVNPKTRTVKQFASGIIPGFFYFVE